MQSIVKNVVSYFNNQVYLIHRLGFGNKKIHAFYVANLGVVYEYKQASAAQLSVTDDTVINTVSGTFSFSMISSSNDTIPITNGQFRILY